MSAIYKELFAKFYKEKSKIAIQKVFESKVHDSIEDNIESISTEYANIMSEHSKELYDIVDKMIVAKINHAQITHVLANNGGVVTGKITITSI